jgi:hypothetical protein
MENLRPFSSPDSACVASLIWPSNSRGEIYCYLRWQYDLIHSTMVVQRGGPMDIDLIYYTSFIVAVVPLVALGLICFWGYPPVIVWIETKSSSLCDLEMKWSQKTAPAYRYLFVPLTSAAVRARVLIGASKSESLRAFLSAAIALIVIDIVFAAFVVTGAMAYSHPNEALWIFAATAPALMGMALWLSNSNRAVGTVNSLSEKIAGYHARIRDRQGSFHRYAIKPSVWGYSATHRITERISDPALRSGVRVAAWFYLAVVIVVLAFAAISVIVAIVLMLLALAIVGFILSQMGEDTESDEREPQRPIRRPSAARPAGATRSRVREGFLGPYTEHVDDHGRVVGTSREREGFLGSYTEHRDRDGNMIGDSRQREGFLGSFAEHRDREGNVIGESRQREGLFGSYTEHRDKDGKITGESRERDGFLSPYTEHEPE